MRRSIKRIYFIQDLKKGKKMSKVITSVVASIVVGAGVWFISANESLELGLGCATCYTVLSVMLHHSSRK